MKAKKSKTKARKTRHVVTAAERLTALEIEVNILKSLLPTQPLGAAAVKREGGSTAIDFEQWRAYNPPTDETPCFIRVRFNEDGKEYTYRIKRNHGLKVGDYAIANHAKVKVTQVDNVPPYYWLRIDEHKWITEKLIRMKI